MIKKLIVLLSVTLCASSVFAKTFQNGMVVSESRIASLAGAEILAAGGNAVDAAVTVGYVLAVVKPSCGNIGGGGFMTLHLANGQNIFLNFRETAPAAANPDMYRNKQSGSTLGFLAVGVPGTVLGLETALRDYGTMSREQVMAKAIEIAEKGYKVTPYDAQQFKDDKALFLRHENVKKIFTKKGSLYRPGQLLKQPELAKTLRMIAKEGSKVFYKGEIAKAIVAASKANDGILTLNDFENYTVTKSAPIVCHYRDYKIISAPPPSSGGITLCEMLNILENFPLKKWGQMSLSSTQTIIESMRYSFIDRNTKLGDPSFINNPTQQLLSPEYAKKISEKISKTEHAPPTFAPDDHPEMTDTTHFSVMDKKGNAVSVTYTLNGFFGAGVIAGDTGFFLNNEMDDFSTVPGVPNKFGLVQSRTNEVQAKKRPLSSMTPTIVLKDGDVFMVTGSPGGPRIITSVLLSFLNVVDFDMPLQIAVNKPRFHYQANPDVVDSEPFSAGFIFRHKLESLGYHVLPQKTWGAVEAILVNPRTGQLEGGSDTRRPDGAAIQSP